MTKEVDCLNYIDLMEKEASIEKAIDIFYRKGFDSVIIIGLQGKEFVAKWAKNSDPIRMAQALDTLRIRILSECGNKAGRNGEDANAAG